jgi:transglutaminase-like putative cysteine protease
MKSRRDAYLVIHLCYFIIAAEFLFDQSIGTALYGCFAMVIVTAAFVGLHQLHTRVRASTSLRTAAVLVFQAIPLMLVLFLFFPRVAPLWSVPLPGGSNTGISDHVAPGDIAALTRSGEIAFRAQFDGAIPPLRDLYWRGLVYSKYQDGVWSVAGTPSGSENAPAAAGSAAAFLPERTAIQRQTYQVLLEPTQATWLFSLDVAMPVTRGTALTRDFRLIADEPVHAMIRYRAEAYPNAVMDASLPDWLWRRETQLPDGDNARIVAFAHDVAARTRDPEDFLAALLRHIRTEPYVYTLNPPALARHDSVDTFWFDTRRGFCSHFAGAFVYLARAAGIPARLVGGYQGGEVNPRAEHLIVHQFDAHAWAEVWLPGRGWVRYDPTAAVAPARIESGINAALSEADRAVLAQVSGSRFDGVPGLRDVMYLFESMQHRWNMWVVGYDTELQASYLADLLGEVTPTRIGAAMLLGGVVSLSLVVLSLFWRRRTTHDHPAQRVFRRFAERMVRMGLARLPEETPGRYLRRVNAARHRAPSEIVPLVDHLDALLYNPEVPCTKGSIRTLRRSLRRLQVDVALRARS